MNVVLVVYHLQLLYAEWGCQGPAICCWTVVIVDICILTNVVSNNFQIQFSKCSASFLLVVCYDLLYYDVT
jgi:hypothetical protein